MSRRRRRYNEATELKPEDHSHLRGGFEFLPWLWLLFLLCFKSLLALILLVYYGGRLLLIREG